MVCENGGSCRVEPVWVISEEMGENSVQTPGKTKKMKLGLPFMGLPRYVLGCLSRKIGIQPPLE